MRLPKFKVTHENFGKLRELLSGRPDGEWLRQAAKEWCEEHGATHYPLSREDKIRMALRLGQVSVDLEQLSEAELLVRIEEALAAKRPPQVSAKPKRKPGRPPRDSEYADWLALWESGDFKTKKALAEHLKVDRSTVSKGIAEAEKHRKA